MDDAGLDPLHVGRHDRLHPPLAEERGRECLAGRHAPGVAEVHAVHPEVAEALLIRDVDDLGPVSHALLHELVLNIERVFECGPLTGAGSVPHPDEKGLALPLLQFLHDPLETLRCLGGMPRRADRPRVAIRAQARRRTEVQLGTGGIDEVVVLEHRDFARPVRIRVPHVHVRAIAGRPALAVQFGGECLMEFDSLAPVYGGERKRHLLHGHLPDPDPDIRRDPVPLRVGRDHHYLVLPAQHSTQVKGRSVAGYAGSQDDGARHTYPRWYRVNPQARPYQRLLRSERHPGFDQLQ